MNSYFRWYRMDTDLCVEYAEMRLRGQAKIFWENEYLAAERRGLPITTWAEMVQKLRNKYVPRQYEATLFLSWLDLRQGKSPVRDYIQTFEECRMRCRFVEDPRIVIGLFTHGLTTRLRNEVLKSCPLLRAVPTVHPCYPADSPQRPLPLPRSTTFPSPRPTGLAPRRLGTHSLPLF